jgi:transcriptional regulator with XRE-family HTH domain
MGKKLVTPGDYVHARRRDLAITKGEAARMAGLTDGQWRDIEDGLRPPTNEALTAVARVLRIDPIVLQRHYR